MPAHTPRTSLSPLREADPVFFCRADQRPSVAASDMVSFEGSEYEILDDSVSSSMTPPFLSLENPANLSQAWTPKFSASCQELWTSWAWSGLHQRSPHAAAWMSSSCWGAVRTLCSASFTVLPGSSQRTHQVVVRPLLGPPTYFLCICPHFGRRR